MEKRLRLAKNLLKDDGVIFVSIDDHEQAYLKVLMDEVFGEQNFAGNAVRKTAGTISTRSDLPNPYDYLLIYAKNKGKDTFKKQVYEIKEYPEKDEKGNYRLVSLRAFSNSSGETDRPSLAYDFWKLPSGELTVNNPNNSDAEHISPNGGRWLWSKKKLISDQNLIVIINGKPFTKRYQDEEDNNKYKLPSLWIENILNARGTRCLKAILGNNSLFSYPKPVDIVKWCLNLHPNKDAVVLDFFAGSGTTGQAVAELNKEDGGHRQAILCTNNFEQDGSENGIARDVTAERLKRVLTGKNWADGKDHEELPGNLSYYQIVLRDDYSTEVEDDCEKLGIGFYDGIAALKENTHIVSDKSDETSTVLESDDKVVLVAYDYYAIAFYDEQFKKRVSEVKKYAEDSERGFVLYVLSQDEEYEVNGVSAHIFPDAFYDACHKLVKPFERVYNDAE